MSHIRIGSRDSSLAVSQTRLVMAAMEQQDPDLKLELITMKTTGDQILDRTLDKVGGKGLFVKELDQALLEGRIDLAVHSLKDMPMETDPRLPILAVSRREDPRDVLILPENSAGTAIQGPIGCASLRRRYQLAALYPDVETKPIRGNLQTRLAKLDRGEYGALVLAMAGIRRLGWEARVSRIFEPEEILPAAGQGILAVQGRRGEDFSSLSAFYNKESHTVMLAERAFVAHLDGGCSSPIAAFGQLEGDTLRLRGIYWKETGEERIPFAGQITGPANEARNIGHRLAESLLACARESGDPAQKLVLRWEDAQ